VQQFVSHTFAIMGDIWPPLIYLIVAVWVGVESAGIGLPIEPMMLFAGSLATQGKASVVLTVLITSFGCLAFAGLAYAIGRREGTAVIARFGRFIGLNQTRADHLELWLRHRGALGIFIARVTPMVRTFGSYVMGAADISPTTFTLSTIAGSLVYCGGWIVAGFLLGKNYQAPLAFLQDHFSGGAVLILAAVAAVVIVLHYLSGRLGLHRIALHFRRHGAMAQAAQVATR
jgi:membrane protein DedA with SNARE-associated domain